MPIYEYRCPRCAVYEVIRPLGAAPDVEACPTCGQPARRRISAPHLSRTNTPSSRLIDAAARSATEPDVITGGIPPSGARSTPAFSVNPLSRKLPRP
ncbi:FmdB family zinc ribbon protein [Arthrobacter sp. MDT1-65]